ncbi:MAG: hypothetical protein ACK4WD_00805 [Flavobacteriales bacterium]|jgi:hypothetical protein
MIRYILGAYILFGLVTAKTYCQDSLNYKSKWQTRPNYGVNIPITKLLDGRITDNLIEYSDYSNYMQVLSVAYFFHKRWGVEFNFQGNKARNNSSRAINFSNTIKSEYDNNYFVSTSTSGNLDRDNSILGNSDRLLLGVIYRYEKIRFFIYPKLSLGVSSFRTDWGNATLKQRNSNNVLEVSYSSGNRANDHFTVAPSIAFGYKLSKRVYLNFDVMASYYKTDLTFIKEIKDLNTESTTTESFAYRKDIFTLSIGGGLIIVIK